VLNLQCNDNATSLIQPWVPTSDVLIDEIDFSTKKTYLNIIIEDENDNPPVFTYPNRADFKVGYPAPEILVKRLLPPYLTQVEATDADDGINAKIKFSINPSTHFDINHENGEIYPKEELENSTTFTVTATDKDGAVDGLTSTISINVIKLTSESIVEMRVPDFVENLDDFIYDLSEAVNLDIRVINYAPIPKPDPILLSKLSDFNNVNLIIFVYAFGSNGDLIKGQNLIDALKAVGTDIKFSLIYFEVPEPVECESPSIAGWIAAIVVLSILLVIVITAPLIYFFLIKKKVSEPEPRRVSESSSSKEIQENFYSEPGQSTPLPNTEVESQTAVSSEDERVGGEVVEINEGKIDMI
jgi:hypothetical protein